MASIGVNMWEMSNHTYPKHFTVLFSFEAHHRIIPTGVICRTWRLPRHLHVIRELQYCVSINQLIFHCDEEGIVFIASKLTPVLT